jgi:hypothetical protein
LLFLRLVLLLFFLGLRLFLLFFGLGFLRVGFGGLLLNFDFLDLSLSFFFFFSLRVLDLSLLLFFFLFFLYRLFGVSFWFLLLLLNLFEIHGGRFLGLLGFLRFFFVRVADGFLLSVFFIVVLIKVFGLLRSSFDWHFEELIEDLVDLAVENLTGDVRIFSTTGIASILFGHDGNIVDESLKLVMIEEFNELLIEILELLKTIIVIKKLVDRTVLAVEKVLDRLRGLTSVVIPEIGCKESTEV